MLSGAADQADWFLVAVAAEVIARKLPLALGELITAVEAAPPHAHGVVPAARRYGLAASMAV
jgi:hypothetical protein